MFDKGPYTFYGFEFIGITNVCLTKQGLSKELE